MKRHVRSLVLVVAASAALTGCTTARHSAAWDYKVIRGRYHQDKELSQQLQQAASEGWEVVTATSHDGEPIVILRRPK